MRSYLALVRKDIKGYFDQPTGYILIVIFVGLLSYWFFRSALISEEASLRPLFTTDFTVERPSMIWMLALFVPAATMRLLSEEQRDGTMEILLTHPIRGWVVLLAKFVAGLLFVSIAILSTLGIPILLETAGDLDWGAVFAQYIGSIFLAASMVAVGLFTSSLTRNQIVSFILSLFLIMLLMFIGLDRVSVTLPVKLSAVLQTLSPLSHFESIARGVIDLQNPADLSAVKAQWRFGAGLVPGQPNEGLVSQLEGTPARLPDYDDSGWEVLHELTNWHSKGLTFAWYRIKVTLPESVGGMPIQGARCVFETCIDDYGEIWVNGECNRERGTVQGFNVPQRVLVSEDPKVGDQHTIALLAINGPIAAPGGSVFVRFATLAFEWPNPNRR